MPGFIRSVFVASLLTLAVAAVAGPTWQPQSSGVTDPLNGVWFVDSQQGWAVGGPINDTRSVILHTADGGKTWSQQTSPVTSRLFAVQFLDTLHGWASGDDNVILHTDDGGTTWRQQPALGCPYLDPLRGMWMVDATHGWAASDYGGIFHTTDGANWVWEDLSACGAGCAASNLVTIHTYDGLNAMAAGVFGYMFRTVNSGTSWVKWTAPDTKTIYAIRFVSDHELFMVGSVGRIFHSTDGGITWVPQSSGTTVILYGLQMASPAIGWTLGEKGTLLHTIDGGQHWYPQWTGVTTTLRGLSLINLTEGWAVGDNGAILHSTAADQDPVPGDVNGDGVYSAQDVSVALQMVGGLVTADRGVTLQSGVPLPLSIVSAVRLAAGLHPL